MGNNPIRFNDPLGDTLYDKKGKPITYTVRKNGTLKWSKNATPDWKRVGNGLAKTEEGLAQLNKARDAKWGITMKISKETPAKYGQTENDPKNSWDATKGEAKIKVMHITLYEGTMRKDYKDVRTGNANSSDYQGGLYQSLYKRGDFEGALSGNAGHEIEHSADETNVQNTWKNFKLGTTHDLEAVPEAKETAILEAVLLNRILSKMFVY